MAKVTICLPVYNGANFVEQALQSITQQSYSDIIVLASNNASTDNTLDILEKWKNKISMHIINQPKTLPMCEHFNSLLNLVSTEFYMLLCHDDFFYDNDAILKAKNILDDNKDISTVYSDLIYVGEKRNCLAKRRFRRKGKCSANQIGMQTISYARNMFGIPILIRNSALGKHRYDSTMPHVMDVDLSWSIAKDGHILHIPELLLANRYSGSNTTWSQLSQIENELLCLAKKHGINLHFIDKLIFYITNWKVKMQKRVFWFYERLSTRLQ